MKEYTVVIHFPTTPDWVRDQARLGSWLLSLIDSHAEFGDLRLTVQHGPPQEADFGFPSDEMADGSSAAEEASSAKENKGVNTIPLHTHSVVVGTSGWGNTRGTYPMELQQEESKS